MEEIMQQGNREVGKVEANYRCAQRLWNLAFVKHLHCKTNRADEAKKTFALRTKMIGVGEHVLFRYKAREFRSL